MHTPPSLKCRIWSAVKGVSNPRRHLAAAVAAVLASLASVDRIHALEPARRLTQYVHDTWTSRNGLPHNTVRVVFQDRRGYLWVGTRRGLERFDGLRFTSIDLGRTGFAAEPPEVRAIAEGRGGLWVGTGQPADVYLVQNGAVARHQVLEGLSEAHVLALHEDEPSGRLFVGTSKGLWRVTEAQVAAVPLGEDAPQVARIVGDGEGGLWLGTDGGLVHWKDGVTRRLTVADGLGTNDVRSLRRTRDGDLWIGTRLGGLSRLHDGRLTTFGLKDGLPSTTVYALAEDADGHLWIGTRAGLARRRDGRITSRPAPPGLAEDPIEDVFVDREHSLWISTLDRGLHRLRDGVVTAWGRSEGLPSDRFWAVRRDPHGFFWLGTDDGLVRWSEDGSRPLEHYRVQNCEGEARVKSILVHSSGAVWFGSHGRLYRLRPPGRPELVDLGGKLSCEEIESMVEDEHGAIWIGTRGDGLLKYDGGNVTRYTTADGLPDDHVRALLMARDHTLWAGTHRGLARLHRGKWEVFGAHHRILTIFEDAEGVLWLGSGLGGGLKRFARDEWTDLTRAEGLASNTVYSLAEDDLGYLWVMCERGLYRVSKRQLEAVAQGRRQDLPAPRVYDEIDGLRTLISFGTRDPGAWKTADGRLWFATPHGLACIDPRRLPANEVPPALVIETVLRNGQELELGSPQPRAGEPANYEFRYTALSLATPDRARFQYRLEGAEQEWVDAGSRRSAYYARLPAGHYVFRVRASNEDGVWTEKDATVELHPRAPFHQRRAFQGAIAVVVILVGVGIGWRRRRPR